MLDISKTVNKISFTLAKHSPEILIVAGVVGTVVSAVMACKASTKIGAILDKTKEDVNTIREYASTDTDEYTEEDRKKDLVITYTRTGVDLVKLYGPAVLLGALSISSILASNSVLRKRSAALTAAYATIDRGFKKYRNRVIERFGEEVDRELRHNIVTKKYEEVSVDENGKEKKTNVDVKVASIDPYSDYARWFDESCYDWENNFDYNMTTLKMKQQYANDLLNVKKHLFLNEVYDMLGLPRSKAGQIVGWVYGSKTGDNFVDFGISDVHREVSGDPANGYEQAILLDFNVDGNIWDLMKEE